MVADRFVEASHRSGDIRERWHTTQVHEVMRAVTADHFVDTSASLTEARELMQGNRIGAVGVLDNDGKLVGFLGGQIIKRRAKR